MYHLAPKTGYAAPTHPFSYRYMRLYLHARMISFAVSLGRLSSLEQQTSNGMLFNAVGGYDPAASPSGLRIVP